MEDPVALIDVDVVVGRVDRDPIRVPEGNRANELALSGCTAPSG